MYMYLKVPVAVSLNVEPLNSSVAQGDCQNRQVLEINQSKAIKEVEIYSDTPQSLRTEKRRQAAVAC